MTSSITLRYVFVTLLPHVMVARSLYRVFTPGGRMDIFSDQGLIFSILLTLKVAGVATLSAGVLSLAQAWLLTGNRIPGSRWVDAVCALPLVLPPTVIGYCLILLIGRRGILGQWLAEFGINLIFSWQGAVVAATVVIFPLCYRSARAALESVDHSLEDAARTLGASEPRIFLRVSMPLAWRGIFAGITLAFARGMGEFGATLMIAGNLPGKTQTLALAIYDSFQAGNDDRALVLVLLTSGLCATMLVLAEMAGGARFSTRRF
jgi:molybdate transport system permease protein